MKAVGIFLAAIAAIAIGVLVAFHIHDGQIAQQQLRERFAKNAIALAEWARVHALEAGADAGKIAAAEKEIANCREDTKQSLARGLLTENASREVLEKLDDAESILKPAAR